MANITLFDAKFNPVRHHVLPSSIIDKVKKIERRVFPKSEAIDFDAELRKRNVELWVLLANIEGGMKADGLSVAAYMLYAYQSGAALLHKLCVVESHRRRGTGRILLTRLCERLRSRGCVRLYLWVAFERTPAKELYESLGFGIAGRAKDYYGFEKEGVRMTLDLS